MNDDAPLRKQWISSLDVINKTGISRATLNNYIKMNLLPRPAVKRPETTDARARMLGYFPDSVIETIIQIKELKKQGYSMDAIADRFKRSHLTPATRMKQKPPSGNVFFLKQYPETPASHSR